MKSRTVLGQQLGTVHPQNVPSSLALPHSPMRVPAYWAGCQWPLQGHSAGQHKAWVRDVGLTKSRPGCKGRSLHSQNGSAGEGGVGTQLEGAVCSSHPAKQVSGPAPVNKTPPEGAMHQHPLAPLREETSCAQEIHAKSLVMPPACPCPQPGSYSCRVGC